ncbi:hypothetical protein C8Q73DRAFT_669639, partial [Cubamyces lactineus]
MAARQPPATAASQSAKNKGGKPGHPGSFSEGRLALFEEYQSDFNKLTKMARNSQNQFWASFFNVYWARFPYTVPLKEEPSPSTLLVPDESVFTDEQRAQKGKTLKATVKLYMSKKKDDVDRLTAERCLAEDTPESLVLAVRSDVARELLAKETAEYRKALQVECEETIEAERAEAESAATEPVITPVTQAEARDKLAVVVQPLLNLIREYTGFYLTLIAGFPLADTNQLTVLTFMGSFTDFLAHTAEGLSRSAGAGQATTSTTSALSMPSPADLSMLVGLSFGETAGHSPRTLSSQKRPTEGAVENKGDGGGGGERPDPHPDLDLNLDFDSDSSSGSSSDDEEDELDPDALGLTDAVKRQLALRSPKTQRMELSRIRGLSSWDRETLCARVGAAEIVASMAGGSIDIPLHPNAPAAVAAALRERAASGKAKGKRKRDAAVSAVSPAVGPLHTSSRLAKNAQSQSEGGEFRIGASLDRLSPQSHHDVPVLPTHDQLSTLTDQPSTSTDQPSTPTNLELTPTSLEPAPTSAQPAPTSAQPAPTNQPSTPTRDQPSTPTRDQPSTPTRDQPSTPTRDQLSMSTDQPSTLTNLGLASTSSEPALTSAQSAPTRDQLSTPTDRRPRRTDQLSTPDQPGAHADRPPSRRKYHQVRRTVKCCSKDGSGRHTIIWRRRNFGDDFTCTIEWWTIIDVSMGGKTSTKGLGTEHRPPELGGAGGLVCSHLGECPMGMDGLLPAAMGRGAILRSPGKNGLLMVLLSLVWWRDAATDAHNARLVSSSSRCAVAAAEAMAKQLLANL